ncbi:hypothetical protein DAERI_220013 [Deinococcus aerius]|uniref:ArsR family transcriptional regulator n=1 Tax=Deinococcus aerius TaxID=200253 RepID=A0A2I9DBL3_9DEIO|nr:helix-turn-helix domain-containing protein [Deinococcus aerius]GBF08070.1 hypothetical protein DAERI_220013 [Deinococcus aerius]
MTLPDSPSFHQVTDPRQAAILTDPAGKAFFAPFLARERTVREAAEIVGCALNTMLYRVRVMLAAGLLKVVEVRPRAGRAIKVYRSVYDAYFVPFGVTPYATLEERVAAQGRPLFARLTSAYAAALHAHGLFGNALLLGENGAVWTTDLPPEVTRDGRPLVFSDMTVHLETDQAHQAARQLSGAFREAIQAEQQQASGRTSGYVMMVALIPLDAGP